VPTLQPAVSPDRVADPDAVLGAGWRESTDRAVTTSGDPTGLHVLVADRADAYQWRTVATLSEPMLETDQWIGQLCVNGAGSHAVVVYAPRTFTNHPHLMEAGAFAAIVDLDSGDVTKLEERVTLAYFNPACGADGTAALSRLENRREVGEPAQTWIGTISTTTGTIVAEVRTDGQLTSAVPIGDAIIAAKGNALVEVGADGESTIVTHTAGAPLRLMPEGEDGLAFQVARDDEVDLARLADDDTVQVVGTVPLGAVKLRPGAGGAVYATGERASERTAGNLPDGWRAVDGLPDSQPSTKAGLLVTRATTRQEAAGRLASAPAVGDPHPVWIEAELLDTTRSTQEFEVAPATEVAGGLPSPSLGGPAGVDSGSRPESGAAPMAVDYSDVPWDPDRACAVPRNDPQVQVYQPSAQEVEWAVDLAVRGQLTANRPANWLNSGLPSYSPQGLFPSKSLSGGGFVPAQIMLAVVAQESNLYQASWRVVDGLAGNPLTSSGFYGIPWDDPDPHLIDWSDVDCGYGAAQVTTGMHTDDTGQTVNGVVMTYTKQKAVAQDYAVNIAAGLRILQDKWNQTRNAGLIANDGDPSKLENWWFALWAYNTGFYPDPGNDQPWGLGWSNNPASPLYPEDRAMFLTAPLAGTDDEVGYDNAKHPNHWSYPERVMGFAYHSLIRWDYSLQTYVPTYTPATMDDNTIGAQPHRLLFCAIIVNDCDPDNEIYFPGEYPDYEFTHCMRDDLMCWWNNPTVWEPNCADCGVENRVYSGGDPAPSMANSIYSSECTTDGLPANAMVVDELDSAAPLGPHGCSRTWGDHGTFELEFGSMDGPGGDSVYPSKVDLHQLNSAFGGHFWMAHVWTPSEAAMRVTGTWRLDQSIHGTAEVWVHLPDHGARTLHANYQVTTEDGVVSREIQQYGSGNRWVSIGNFRFDGQPEVQLRNVGGVDADGTVSIAFDAIAIEPRPQEDSCYGEGAPPFTQSCTGKDPSEMGCGPDGVTWAESQAANGVWVEMRYSAHCHAVWTRYRNPPPASAGEARIWSRDSDPPLMFGKELAVYDNEQGWTPMISATRGGLESCLLFELSGWGFVEHCPELDD
jgi:hypothetical protein